MKSSMPFRGWLVLFSFLLISIAAGQPALDSLKAELAKQMADTNRVRLLTRLSHAKLQNSPAEALEYADSAYSLARSLSDAVGEIEALKEMAYIEGVRGNYSQGLEYARRAEELNDNDRYLKQAFSTATAFSYLYEQLGDNWKSFEYAEKSLELARRINDKEQLSIVYHNLAVSYERLGLYKNSIEYAQKAIDERALPEPDIRDAYSYGVMAAALRETGQPEKALEQLQEVLEILRRAGDKRGMLYSFNEIGITYSRLKRYEKALVSLYQGLSIARTTGARSEMRVIYESIMSTYEAMGQFKEALAYHKRFKELSDSLAIENPSQRLAEIQNIYDLSQGQHEFELLRKDQELHDSELNKAKLIRNFLIASLLLIGIIAILIFNSYRLKRNAVDAERSRNETLQQLNLRLTQGIEERRIVEQELRKSEMMLNLVMDNIPEAIFWKDRDGLYLGCNRRFALDAGLGSAEQVRSINSSEFRWREGDSTFLSEGDMQVMRENSAKYHLIHSLVQPDGSRAWLDINKIPLHNARGHVVGLLCTYEDITERQKVEGALAKERERLDVTLKSISDGVITVNTAGRIIFINRAAANLTGWQTSNALERDYQDVLILIDEQSRGTLGNLVEEVIDQQPPLQLSDSILLIARNGAEIPVEVSVAPISNFEEGILGVVLAFKDTTGKREREEELLKSQKLESVGVLAGGIAHDFNNILTGIMANISFAKMFPKSQKSMYERLGEAEKACVRARDLTQQLLTFARGGAPITHLTSMEAVINSSIRFALRGTNVRFEMECDAQLYHCDVDENQINQVLHNMAINSVQAMPNGGVLRITAQNLMIEESDHIPALSPGRYVRICIQDEGIGIPREHLEKIFDPYFTTKQAGTGLGLATSYSIIKNHNGMLTVDSSPGKGAAFYIFLPGSDKQLMTEHKPKILAAGRPGRILVMDDDPMIVDIVDRMLRETGYTVVGVGEGGEAIAKCREAQHKRTPFDLVILDLTIPGGMGGKETLSSLREIDPHLKAIVSSGYSNDPVLSNYRQYGFDSYLKKPFNYEGLHTAIEQLHNNSAEANDPS